VANDMYFFSKDLAFTPIAELRYAYLVKQDTKFDPKWSVTLVFDPKNNPDHKKFLKALSDANKAIGEELLKGITKGKNAFRIKDIVRAEEDSDGNTTGKYLLKVTTKIKPLLKDSQGAVVSDAVGSKIGNGSTGRVALSLKKSVVSTQKTVGLTAYFTKAQIVELVEYSGGSGGDDFGAVDGGFVSTVDGAGSTEGDF